MSDNSVAIVVTISLFAGMAAWPILLNQLAARVQSFKEERRVEIVDFDDSELALD